MHPFLYTTLWICFLFYLVCNIDGRDAESGKPSGRMKGGEKASIEDFPWAVSLRRFAAGGIQCGGSIIGSKWILTAAHCMDPMSIKPGWITAGKTEGSSKYLRDRWFIERYHVHPTFYQYKTSEGELVVIKDDIALLELKTELPIPGSVTQIKPIRPIRPIRLSQTDVKTDQQCQVVGWGEIDGKGNRASGLMKINVHIRKNCRHWRSVLLKPEDNICISKSTQQACESDSGGPLMCKENGEYFLKGVLSAGTRCELAIGASTYTNVNKYVEWIEEKTKLDFGFTKDRSAVHARMYHQNATARSGMNNGGNASDTPNLSAISAEELDGLPRPDELNELDGRYKLDGDTAQPEYHGPNVPDDSKTVSGLDNHDASLMSTNSATMSLTTSNIIMFVSVPIFVIGLIVVLVGAMVVIRKSSHPKKDSIAMTEHLPAPGTK